MSCQETNPTIVQILQLLDANTKTVNNLKNQAATLRSLSREDLHAIMRTHEVMTSAAPLVFKKLASKPVSLDKDTESINESIRSIKELISLFGDVLNSWHEHVHIAFLAFDLIRDHGTLEDLENMVPRIKGIWEEKEEMETFLMMRAKYMQCLLKEVSLSNIEAPYIEILSLGERIVSADFEVIVAADCKQLTRQKWEESWLRFFTVVAPSLSVRRPTPKTKEDWEAWSFKESMQQNQLNAPTLRKKLIAMIEEGAATEAKNLCKGTTEVEDMSKKELTQHIVSIMLKAHKDKELQTVTAWNKKLFDSFLGLSEMDETMKADIDSILKATANKDGFVLMCPVESQKLWALNNIIMQIQCQLQQCLCLSHPGGMPGEQGLDRLYTEASTQETLAFQDGSTHVVLKAPAHNNVFYNIDTATGPIRMCFHGQVALLPDAAPDVKHGHLAGTLTVAPEKFPDLATQLVGMAPVHYKIMIVKPAAMAFPAWHVRIAERPKAKEGEGDNKEEVERAVGDDGKKKKVAATAKQVLYCEVDEEAHDIKIFGASLTITRLYLVAYPTLKTTDSDVPDCPKYVELVRGALNGELKKTAPASSKDPTTKKESAKMKLNLFKHVLT